MKIQFPGSINRTVIAVAVGWGAMMPHAPCIAAVQNAIKCVKLANCTGTPVMPYQTTWTQKCGDLKVTGIAVCAETSSAGPANMISQNMSDNEKNVYCWCKRITPLYDAKWKQKGKKDSYNTCIGTCAMECPGMTY